MSSKTPVPPSVDLASLEPAPTTALEAFLDKNFKSIAYAVLGLVAASGVYGVVQYQGKQAALEAALAATQAKTVIDCDQVIAKYKGSVAGGNALLTKAKLEWADNKKDSAVKTLRAFKEGYSSHPFYLQGIIALASRLESLGGNDAKEAQGLYEDIVKNHKDSELAGLAELRLGDLLWAAGKEDEAKKIYEELPRKFPGQFFDEGEKRRTWIAAGLPTKEVDAPKVPDALKAPAPSAGTANAPAINLTPGKSGVPATSAPFEVKMNPPAAGGGAAQPKLKIEPAPATNGKSPLTAPSGAPLPSTSNGGQPQIKLEPKETPKLQINPAPSSAPAVAPGTKVEVKPQPAAAPAPAAPAKAAEAPKK